MKKTNLIWITVLLASLSAFGQTVDTTTGLIAEYTCDGITGSYASTIPNVVSSDTNIGKVNNGTIAMYPANLSLYYSTNIKNTTKTMDFTSNYNSTSPQYVDVNPLVGLGSDSDFTVSFWYACNPLDTSVQNILNIQKNYPNTIYNGVSVYLHTSNGNQFVNVVLDFQSNLTGGSQISINSKTINYNAYTFHHVAIVFSKPTIKILMDGLERDTSTSSNIYLNESDLTIGGNNSAKAFSGYLDNIKIYNRAITNNELMWYNPMSYVTNSEHKILSKISTKNSHYYDILGRISKSSLIRVSSNKLIINVKN